MTSSRASRTSASPTRQRSLLRLAASLLALTLLGAGGFLAWSKVAGARSDNGNYQLATVQRGDLEDLVAATGTLQPLDYVDVGAQVSGQITRIHVEVGSQVKAGELLAEIDPTVYLANVDATRAQLRSQRAQLAERQAQLALAEIQHAREQRLMAQDATSMDALQVAEAALRSARAQIEALTAQIEQTESSLRAEQAKLQYARIYAPMAGTVVAISARQGQTINASQQAPDILRIADLSVMTVQTQVSEADVGKLRLGMDVWFTTLGGQGRRWHGTLRKIEPTPLVQNNVVLYNALFDVPNRNDSLMTQMTAQVFFVVASARNVLIVPQSALTLSERPAGAASRQRPERGEDVGDAPENPASRRAMARVMLPAGTIEEREVRLGISNRVQAEVVSGLSESERVVTGMRSQTAKAQTGSAGSGPGGFPGASGPRLR